MLPTSIEVWESLNKNVMAFINVIPVKPAIIVVPVNLIYFGCSWCLRQASKLPRQNISNHD